MHINKRFLLLLLTSLLLSLPLFGQRFTKKEQALREARAINYFYGNSFTFSAGYVHSWLSKDVVDLSNSSYIRSGIYQNVAPGFTAAFSWDWAHKKNFGLQTTAAFLRTGGEYQVFQDLNLGYGPQLREDLSETIRLNQIQVTFMPRYFIPLTYESRLSLNLGVYIARVVGSYDDANDWNLGAVCGVGYDYEHWSASISYQPGIFNGIIEGSDTRQNALLFSIGYRLWK